MAKLHTVTCAISNEELVSGHVPLGALHHFFLCLLGGSLDHLLHKFISQSHKKYSLKDP